MLNIYRLFIAIACSFLLSAKSGAAPVAPSNSACFASVDSQHCVVEYPEELSNCTAVFTADATWSSNYPSCTVTVSLDNCEAEPSASFSGTCYPDEGEVLVGQITVLDGGVPIRTYELRVRNGSGVIILIEDM